MPVSTKLSVACPSAPVVVPPTVAPDWAIPFSPSTTLTAKLSPGWAAPGPVSRSRGEVLKSS